MEFSGSPIDFLVAFLGGILVSFTPCVYPLIPIAAGYIGVTSSGSKAKGLFLSLLYVTGVAITYSALGLIASVTGEIFGRINSSPITHLFVGIVIILFGFSMLDLFALPLPNMIKLPAIKKHNYLSAFLLGLSSGLIVSPCLTPVLGSILVYLATKRNFIYGATLLFSFAYGMGLILILAGIFSSLLVNLPKSGKWMMWIKRIFALFLCGIGIYLIIVAIKEIVK
ncbi:MAG: cytochrome c biogenesis protein CcdA [Candidatus Omnitrophica bacterium]|nr:cytochrome c biogenesis protein CcdA [Candidatus Omnitrophota bacterium]